MAHGQQQDGDVDHLGLGLAARRATSHVVKARARHYLRRPGALEALYPGLSMAPAATLVAVAEHLVERERASPRRWFGFGGEVSLTNAQAALLAGRALRLLARRSAPAPAEETPADAGASRAVRSDREP